MAVASNSQDLESEPGILPASDVRRLGDKGVIDFRAPPDEGQFQPASLDLRLGPKAYRVRASFLPGAGVADLDELLRQLERIGSPAPLSLEAFDTQRVERIGAVEFARELGDATRSVWNRQSAEDRSSRSRHGPKHSG